MKIIIKRKIYLFYLMYLILIWTVSRYFDKFLTFISHNKIMQDTLDRILVNWNRVISKDILSNLYPLWSYELQHESLVCPLFGIQRYEFIFFLAKVNFSMFCLNFIKWRLMMIITTQGLLHNSLMFFLKNKNLISSRMCMKISWFLFFDMHVRIL